MQSRRAPLPPLTGTPGLCQGAYGDRGNLELVVPGADGGLWVFWFNADAVEHRAGAAIGCWSGGLRFFADHDVRSARITQVAAGPRFLEVVAVTADAALHRLYWTPDDGFVHAGVLARSVRAVQPVAESAVGLAVPVAFEDGSVHELSASLQGYPQVAWTSRPTTPTLPPERWDTHAVIDGQVVGVDSFAGATALAAARTSLDGGRIDVVLAGPDGLAHAHGDGPSWSRPVAIVSQVWAEPDAPVHRG